jgi:hypothetical protein
MPHLKCEACRTRFHTDDRRGDDRLAELVGFQRSRFDGPLPDATSDFLAAVTMALPPPGTER